MEAGKPFYGIEANAAFGLGADVGVFVNHKLGSCVLLGGKMGFGAGIAGAKLIFHKH